ncbi:MAG: DNA polymerase I, partial [Planctomycetaceae bacterium]|nr:DNA polymerase I [Planctomycetaceae bacterium]
MTNRTRQTSLPGFAQDSELTTRQTQAAEPPCTESPDAATGPQTPAETLSNKTVWVVDAHSLIHQVFHALPEMSSSRGEPVGAVFGFTRDLLYLLEEKKPDYLFCAFDLPGKTFRHAMYDQYKIQRAEMPDDLVPQISSIRRVIAALGIPALECESFEADDVLATVARLTAEQGGLCFLVTADKDCRQLIADRVKVYNIRKDEVYDEARLRDEWGIAPHQVVDFQALVGDAVDNVPGVPLIGPKLARQLLEQYGTLEAVLDHAAEVPGAKRKENLLRFRDQALLSRDLVRLDANVPVGIDWAAGKAGRIDVEAALGLFRDFGFRSVGQRIAALAQSTKYGVASAERGAVGREQSPATEQAPLTSLRGQLGFTAHLVDTPELFDTFLGQLRNQTAFSIDTETTSIQPRCAKLVGMSFSWSEEEAWYLPLRSPPSERHLDPETTLAALKPILEDQNVAKIGQNLKYDMIVLRAAGIELAGVVFDTIIASYLLEAGRRNHSLDDLARAYLRHETIKITELIGTGRDQRRMDEAPVRQVADYAAEDAWLPWRLRPLLASKLDEAELSELANRLELPLVDVLAEMEFNGIKVDVSRLEDLSRRFGERMERLEAEIHDLAGRRFNIASPKQLQELLFQQLKLPVIKQTAKTGPSTDADVLEELALVHPLPGKILQYRQYAKLKSTYVDALPQMICEETGRVHASFNQVVTATGRLSSSDPNLQNIPVRGQEAREIRSAFVPGEEGWTLLAADYSQIELRVLAHFSGDARLRDAFARDEDIHARVASQVAGVPIDQVTPEMRQAAKAVNFGVIYGQGAFGLARSLGIPQDAAAKFINSYFEGYPGIEEFLCKVLAECRRTGYAKTILGRRRAISGVREGAGRQRNLAERTAVNTVIQGSAADLIKL